MKKFIVGRFLDFKMVDNKFVVTQVEDLQVIIGEIEAGGMTLSESFQVATIIEKLLPAWKDFKSYLKHKRKGIWRNSNSTFQTQLIAKSKVALNSKNAESGA